MNCNTKGVKGLLRVMEDLHNQGYYLYPAFDDHAPIDLIAVSDVGKTYRIQVKYRSSIKATEVERYDVPLSSVVNGKRIPINLDLIDIWAVYLADSNKVAYVKAEEAIGKTSIRIDPEQMEGKLARN